MSSEVDWGAHAAHQNGHSTSKVDWGDHDPSLYLIDGCMLSEIDWGAHDSSFFLELVHIDHDAKPMDFFTLGLWGGLVNPNRGSPNGYPTVTPAELQPVTSAH